MKYKTMTAVIATLALSAPMLSAGGADDDTLIINGDLEIATKTAAPDHLENLDEIV